jgi:hypothetical protein
MYCFCLLLLHVLQCSWSLHMLATWLNKPRGSTCAAARVLSQQRAQLLVAAGLQLHVFKASFVVRALCGDMHLRVACYTLLPSHTVPSKRGMRCVMNMLVCRPVLRLKDAACQA